MQPTNIFNNQNGMGMSVGVPRNQYSDSYCSGSAQYMDAYSRSQMQAPWDSGNWRDVSQQQVQMHIPFRGMSITSPEDIKPKDIPMDGHMSFFPMDDYSCIYAKVWSNDGVLRTFRFIPEIEQSDVNSSLQPIINQEDLMNRFTSQINQSIGRFESRFDTLQDKLNDVYTIMSSLPVPNDPSTYKPKTTKKEVAQS